MFLKLRLMKEFINKLELLIELDSLELKPTQNKLSIPLVYRIFKKMEARFEFDSIKACDGVIIDGHHRYIASKLANVEIEHFPSAINHSQKVLVWKEIALTQIEYDTESQINYHNFNDARRNGKTLEEVNAILNP